MLCTPSSPRSRRGDIRVPCPRTTSNHIARRRLITTFCGPIVIESQQTDKQRVLEVPIGSGMIISTTALSRESWRRLILSLVAPRSLRRFHFVERSFGRMTRSVRLPEAADTTNASAAYTAGVLTVTLPKREPPASKRLRIPVGGTARSDGVKVSIEGGDPAAGSETK